MADRPLASYLARRLGVAALALVVLSALAFALPRFAAGDPSVALYGAEASAADRTEVRARLGLDRPVPEQYARWLGAALLGDFGLSVRTGRPALVAVEERLPATVVLALSATVLGLLLGMILGATCALTAGRLGDRVGSALAAAATAAPGFWVGMVLVYSFAYLLGWLPFGGMAPVAGPPGFAVYLAYVLLPALSLSLREAGRVALLLRAGMVDALSQPYARVASAKGLSAVAVGLRHALPNALVPVVSSVGLSLSYLLGGAIAVETVFGWPGLGRLMAESAASRDFPVLAVGILAAGVFAIGASLLADVGYLLVDPVARSSPEPEAE
jgi:ABC-type dipeptide/oligopeptide/nickel transport system permease component